MSLVLFMEFNHLCIEIYTIKKISLLPVMVEVQVTIGRRVSDKVLNMMIM